MLIRANPAFTVAFEFVDKAIAWIRDQALASNRLDTIPIACLNSKRLVSELHLKILSKPFEQPLHLTYLLVRRNPVELVQNKTNTHK